MYRWCTFEIAADEFRSTGSRPKVSLKNHDLRGEFAAMWPRHGIPGDSARALREAKERYGPLPPLPGADTFEPPSLVEPQDDPRLTLPGGAASD